jgi:pyruvate/2-oxoglutarate dehydrogenase complex dihydrolipoamide dehydrogenase (E3) component
MAGSLMVVGGGPAGIEAATTAVSLGFTVTVVSNTPLGGRAGWDSLLPSKLWLTAADSVGTLAHGGRLGLDTAVSNPPNPNQLLQQLQSNMQQWHDTQADYLHQQGVNLLMGIAKFSGPSQLTITTPAGQTSTYSPDHIIIATGSVPRFFPTIKPDGQRIIAPRHMSNLKTLPASIIVIGGGATGSEVTYLFNQLGVQTTWVIGTAGVLPGFLPEAGEFLAHTLAQRGVNVITGQDATSVTAPENSAGVIATLADGTTLTADMAFLAVGRTPDVANLAWDEAGLAYEPSALSPYGRLGESNVYLVGDAAGGALMANKAFAQARVAVQHAAGLPVPPVNPAQLLYAIYTEPQVAQVGQVVGDDDGAFTAVSLPYAHNLKAQLLGADHGFVRLVYETATRRLVGATAVGTHAGDVLAPVLVALHANFTLDQLANLYPAHPTLSELSFAVARQGQ